MPSADQPLVYIWYVLTVTGGVVGTALVALALSWFVAHTKKQPRKVFAAIFVFLIVSTGVLGLINEYGIKPRFVRARPSHAYLFQMEFIKNPSEFYLQSKKERLASLQGVLLKQHALVEIHPLALHEWAKEMGSSFPSGHSLNAFFLATLWSYVLYRRKSRWFFVPHIWALGVAYSRVGLGVHAPIDVLAGSCLGLMAGCLVVFTKFFNRIAGIAKTSIFS